jgi:hypothetical protein
MHDVMEFGIISEWLVQLPALLLVTAMIFVHRASLRYASRIAAHHRRRLLNVALRS